MWPVEWAGGRADGKEPKGKSSGILGNCSLLYFGVFYTLYTLILVCAFGPSYYEMRA